MFNKGLARIEKMRQCLQTLFLFKQRVRMDVEIVLCVYEGWEWCYVLVECYVLLLRTSKAPSVYMRT